jgi:hypothetical protein
MMLTMTIVVILDQRGSRSHEDLVGAWSERLNVGLGTELRLPFERTAGDEMQAVASPGALGRVVREALADRQWAIGVGIGAVEEPLPKSVREARGPALWAARDALSDAKRGRQDRPIAVRAAAGISTADEETTALNLERCLGALAFIINRRTPKQAEAADAAWKADYSVKAVIETLGLTPQGTHQRLNAAGVREERELLELAAELARPVGGQ